MGTLEYFHITHIGTSGLKSLDKPIVFNSLSHLKLSKCAISGIATVALHIRVPKLTQLSLSDSPLNGNHVGTEPCTNADNATPATADALFLMLALSGAEARIASLDISIKSHIGCSFLVHFFVLANMNLPTVKSLRVDLSAENNQTEVDVFLDELIGEGGNKPGPLFSDLDTLELQGTNCALRGDILFLGPTLEVLVSSRWAGKLRKLRLRRLKPSKPPFSQAECPHDCLEKSSLALTLLTFRSQGLDVQVWDGLLDEQGVVSLMRDVDVLTAVAK
ncbi:hypothetical protein BDZ89DRAFT_593878 [Hymenopellis radicata]|nr:hypothetical protein BDZ89DRAFT_593878 [Hymenopellis radicata]